MQQKETANVATDGKQGGRGVADYLQVMLKRWKMILTITILATAGTVGYSLTLPNIFTAKTKILPPQQQSGLLSAAMMQGALAAVGGGDILGESKTAKLYVEMLKIESLRDPVIDRFKLQQVYHKEFREDVYRAMAQNVSVLAGKEGIITISVSDKDPKLAADIANSMVDELKKLTARMSMTGANNSKGFLEERIAAAKKDLTEAEENLKGFQTRYKTLDENQQATLSASAAAQLVAQLTSQEVQLDVLRRTYADSSQQVKAVERSIAVLRGKIAQLQGKGVSSALPGFEQIPARGQEYLHLMRKFKTAESVYEMLSKQYEVAKLNAENDVSTVQVIQPALVPHRKSRPDRFTLVLMAAVGSLAAGLVLSLVLENLSVMESTERQKWRGLRHALPLSGLFR